MNDLTADTLMIMGSAIAFVSLTEPDPMVVAIGGFVGLFVTCVGAIGRFKR